LRSYLGLDCVCGRHAHILYAEFDPHLPVTQDMETGMSVSLPMALSPIRAEATLKTTAPSSSRRGILALAVAAGMAVAACGDIVIGPVDHSCPVVNSCQHAGGR
jgi:hypothetical protein